MERPEGVGLDIVLTDTNIDVFLTFGDEVDPTGRTSSALRRLVSGESYVSIAETQWANERRIPLPFLSLRTWGGNLANPDCVVKGVGDVYASALVQLIQLLEAEPLGS